MPYSNEMLRKPSLCCGCALLLLHIASSAHGQHMSLLQHTVNLTAPGGFEAVGLQDGHARAVLDAHLEVESTSQNFIWLLGIPISLIGSTLVVCGLMVQKMSHQALPVNGDSEEPKEPSSLYCLNPKWIGGLILFGAGNLICWVSLGLAPNSVLSCFSSWNIILTMVVAPIFFNEVISLMTKFCAAALVLGCSWVAIAGPRSYRLQTVDHINSLFGYPAFRVSTGCLGAVFVMSLVKYYHVRSHTVWETMTVAQVLVMASISASYAVIFSKCTSSLVQSSLVTQHNELHHQFFIYAILAFLCGVSQIHFLNEGLKHAEASFVIPVYESMSIAIQIVVGGMLFQEYVDFSFLHHIFFWPGVCVVLGGIAALTTFAEADKAEQRRLAGDDALARPTRPT